MYSPGDIITSASFKFLVLGTIKLQTICVYCVEEIGGKDDGVFFYLPQIFLEGRPFKVKK